MRVQVLHPAAGGWSSGRHESGAAALELAQIRVWAKACFEEFT
jgi:hypothetical protein